MLEAGDASRAVLRAELGRDHADAGAEPIDRTVLRAPSLGEDQQGMSISEQLADVTQGLSRARLALRQRERVEQQHRQVIVEAVGEPRQQRVLLRKEMR